MNEQVKDTFQGVQRFGVTLGLSIEARQVVPHQSVVTFDGLGSLLGDAALVGRQEVVGCLNLLTSAVVVWNTAYMQAVIAQLRAEGYPVRDEDLAHLSPARFEHINRLGKYTFAEQEFLISKGLRPLRQPERPFPPAASQP